MFTIIIITANTTPEVTISKGNIVEYATVVWGSWASQIYRLWKDATYIEVEWSVGPVPVNVTCDWNPEGCMLGKEVISRYTADINSVDSEKR